MGSPHAISIYTDGSAYPNPGSTGQGIVISYPDGNIQEIASTGHQTSTIIRAELRACVDALRFLQKDPRAQGINHVCIYSDSQYVVDNYKNVVYGNWQNRGWKTVNGNDVDNQDLWRDFIREIKKICKRVEVFKVKAHSGDKHNEAADKMATKSREGVLKNDFFSERTQVRRWLHITEKKVEINFQQAITFYVQRTDPRQGLFEIHGQILRPKKYFGCRIKIRGELDKHVLRGAHIYKINIKKVGNSLIIKDILLDLGKSSNNKHLIKVKK
jgi:ribonuclease HI